MPAATCEACGTELRHNAKFCDQCGRSTMDVSGVAEYKQVTVLFADVVRSMDLAAALDPERLREIMSEVLRRSVDVVRRYGGTVNMFTGDGVMALFGAPIALEDHAVRACLAALDIQREAVSLAEQVKRRDAIALSLRVGLNSGRVIAGAVGAEPWSYTAVGEQVGMAQRMEQAAPPGGVMLGQSTARLVEHCALLDEPELVRVKNRDEPVTARRLLGIGAGRTDRVEAALVGRRREMAALDEIVRCAIDGRGGSVILGGPAGIGKSRLAREVAAVAAEQDVDVVVVAAESHCAEIPYMVVARLLRGLTGFHDLDSQRAREALRELASDGDEQDLLLLADLLGSRDPAAALAGLDPDARRRRLSALIIRIVRQRERTALCIVEHARWIDPASQSMLADLATEMAQTRSVLLITQRPEYRGALQTIAGARSIILAPLGHSDTTALVGELIGADPSVAAVTTMIARQADGNPFFAEEIVRDLRDRGVLEGQSGDFRCATEVTDITVPATVQAAVTARIDRLSAPAKRTLCAAAVIGDRFSADVLTSLGVEARVDELIDGEFIDEIITRPVHLAVLGVPQSQLYAFRQRIIRSVAYESQLRSARARQHRRLAAIIQERHPDAADANAERVAEHLEAAGDLRDAYEWHMRAGTWSSTRDIASAQLSWRRARQVADRLPRDEPEVLGMRIAPRAALCASMWLIGGSVADTGFEELDELCAKAGDKLSLAVGMAGQIMSRTLHNEVREASRLAAEHIALLESIGDPTLLMGMSHPGLLAHCQAGEMAEALRVGERVIELADGDVSAANLIVGSPLAIAMAMCSFIKCSLGIPGWRHDAEEAMAMARGCDAISFVTAAMYKYVPVMYGAITVGDDALRDTADALRIAERSGDDFTVGFARFTRGMVLVHHANADTAEGLELLAAVRELSAQERLSMTMLPPIDNHLARVQADAGDLDGAIELCRNGLDDLYATSGMLYLSMSAELLGELLLRRGGAGDLGEVDMVVDRLAAVRTDPGYVFNELSLLRLRALLARARGDEAGYRLYAKGHGELADSIGFDASMSPAAAMS
jgi:class 3 adenylate cyclase